MSVESKAPNFISRLPPAVRRLVHEGITPESVAAAEQEIARHGRMPDDPTAVSRLVANLRGLEQFFAREREGRAAISALLNRQQFQTISIAQLDELLAEGDKMDSLDAQSTQRRTAFRQQTKLYAALGALVIARCIVAVLDHETWSLLLLSLLGVGSGAAYFARRRLHFVQENGRRKMAAMYLRWKRSTFDLLVWLCFCDAGLNSLGTQR
jgi:hypothetical protein